MPRQTGQKLKILILCKTLLERSDEEHPLTIPDLIAALAEEGISAERKSVYTDLTQLADFGLDVQCRRGGSSGWFIGSREFELPELKLLVDAVQSSKFITTRKSDALISKLEGLCNRYDARQLQRQVYVDRRVKTMNESIYYNVDKLHTAIGTQRIITFRYFDFNAKKERVFRQDGSRYTVSPYGLIWNSENYYLVGWDQRSEEVRHYRVDKLADIAVTCLPIDPIPKDFSMGGYAGRHFSMFGGREGSIKLRCRENLAGVVIDRFGRDVMLVPDGKGFFTVTVQVAVSPQFFGWLFGLGGGVELVSPAWARKDYQQALEEVFALHNS